MNRFDALMPRVWAVLRAKQDLRGRVRERDDQRRYLRIRDTAGQPDTAEMMIYDEIGLCGVTAMDVVNELAAVTAPNLHVHINSPGGDVFDSIAIYNALLDHPAKVQVTVDGLAASGASIIAMAGDHVTMNRASQMMIHDAYTMTIGNEADLREMADLLSRSSEAIAGVYADRAGGHPAEWRARMRAETWYGPQEAVDARLAHATTGSKPAEQVPAYNLANSVFFFAGRAAAPPPDPKVDVAVGDPSSSTVSDPSPDAPRFALSAKEVRRAIREGMK